MSESRERVGKFKQLTGNDGSRGKVLHLFAGFLIFMLVCTMVSRGIYAWQMPQVTVQAAERKAITQKIEATGTVEAQSEQAVCVLAGIRVGKVLVQAGETVEEGTPLFELDAEDLSEKQELLSDTLTVEKQKLEELKAKQTQTEKEAHTAKDRANEDYGTVTGNQNAAVAAAQSEYDAAYQVLASYPSCEVYIQDAKNKSTEYQTIKSKAEQAEATEEDKAAFAAYDAAFNQSSTQEWSEGKASIEQNVKEKGDALTQAGNTRDQQLKAASRAVTDAGNTVSEGSAVAEQQNVVKEKEAELEKYQSISRNGGIVASTLAGTVKTIGVSAGNLTPEGAAVTLSDHSGGWNFTADITEDQKKYINVGEPVTLTFGNGAVKLADQTVQMVNKKEDGGYQVMVQLDTEEISQGESGSLQVTTAPEPSDCCVPLSSLYAAGTGEYVLVLMEKETILGTEYTVEKRKVSVKEKNDEYASLKDNPLGSEEKIVILSDRAVSSGDTVRLLEEND